MTFLFIVLSTSCTIICNFFLHNVFRHALKRERERERERARERKREREREREREFGSVSHFYKEYPVPLNIDI